MSEGDEDYDLEVDFDPNREFRLATVGAGSVGKTALAVRWIKGTFEGEAEYVPTIEESYSRDVVLDDGSTRLVTLLDTAGQEEYHDLRDTYMRAEEGFLLVCSLTDRNSAMEIGDLQQHILNVRRVTKIVIVGNKSDLTAERQVPASELKALARDFKCPYIETSAKTTENVDDAFRALINECQKFRDDLEKGIDYKLKMVDDGDDDPDDDGKCCSMM